MNKLLIGAIAGLAATVPMTILMTAWHRRLPRREQYSLPPREIIDEITEAAAVQDDLSESEKAKLSLIGHFAYGATTGAIYAPLISLIQPPNAVNGIIYGLGIWTTSYLGWLPALNILRPATEHPARRNALMITAHIVWGATLGTLVRQITNVNQK